jgi:hypothetical protein
LVLMVSAMLLETVLYILRTSVPPKLHAAAAARAVAARVAEQQERHKREIAAGGAAASSSTAAAAAGVGVRTADEPRTPGGRKAAADKKEE